MLRFETAGESHGECLVATVSGLPAGLVVPVDYLNRQLWRRQQGYGRGGRMKIETDRAEVVAGVRHSKTTGAPVALIIRNRDWENWREVLPVEDYPGSAEKTKPVNRPRPGHADLAGCLKYDLPEARYILERASARETAARVAAGALAKLLLTEIGAHVLGHVIAAGPVRLERDARWEEIAALESQSDILLGCVDSDTEQRMKAVVDEAFRNGDTVNGVFEVVGHNVPPGLGTHTAWDLRLDGRLAQAVMSMQAVKAVEIGHGVEGAASFGSAVQDPIGYDREQHRFTRPSNRAGGLEGGMTNGEDVVVRGYLKPISTLRRPLASVDLRTRETSLAAYERSDVCVLPAAAVIGEAMVALTLAGAALEKFGGDSVGEMRRNFLGYLEQVKNF